MNLHLVIIVVAIVAFVSLQSIELWLLNRRAEKLRAEVAKLRSQGPFNNLMLPLQWFEPFLQSLTNTILISAVRDVALRQAEEEIYAFREYQFLQKLSVAAPLVGVLLTASGFALFGGKLDDIQNLAAPLAGGVFAGAFLAIVNQAMLHFAENFLQKCRVSCQSLIDHYWVASAERLGDPNRQLAIVSEKFDQTVKQLASFVGDFPSNVGMLTSRFTAIATLTELTFKELSDISPMLKSSVLSWNDAAQKISQATDSEFSHAIECLKSGALTLTTSTSKLEGVVKVLEEASDHFANSSSIQQEAFLSLESLVQSTSKWTKEISAKYVDELKAGIDAIASPLKSTAQSLAHFAPAMKDSGDILLQITKATEGFSNVIETQFVPANVSIDRFAESATNLSEVVETLAKNLTDLERIGRQHSRLQIEISELIQNRALPTVEVLQRATGAFEDSAHRIAECSEELAIAIQQLHHGSHNEEPVKS